MKPQFLYHGSRFLLKALEPKQALGFQSEDNLFGIYASAEKSIASLFAITYVGHSDDAKFDIRQEQNEFYVYLYKTTVEWNKLGYLYTISSKYFQQVDEQQWISHQKLITPQTIETINPYNLQKFIRIVS